MVLKKKVAGWVLFIVPFLVLVHSWFSVYGAFEGSVVVNWVLTLIGIASFLLGFYLVNESENLESINEKGCLK